MDREDKERIADYFDAWTLAELLNLDTFDLIEAFEGEVEEKLHDILELMGIDDE